MGEVVSLQGARIAQFKNDLSQAFKAGWGGNTLWLMAYLFLKDEYGERFASWGAAYLLPDGHPRQRIIGPTIQRFPSNEENGGQ